MEFTDESDKKFYEVAKTIDCKLITGNKKHFPDEENIIQTNELIK